MAHIIRHWIFGQFLDPQNGMDSPPDVPWPGYVNFSGEKKDDDYKAPQRHLWEFGACGNGSSSEDQSWLVVSKLPIDFHIFQDGDSPC